MMMIMLKEMIICFLPFLYGYEVHRKYGKYNIDDSYDEVGDCNNDDDYYDNDDDADGERDDNLFLQFFMDMKFIVNIINIILMIIMLKLLTVTMLMIMIISMMMMMMMLKEMIIFLQFSDGWHVDDSYDKIGEFNEDDDYDDDDAKRDAYLFFAIF